MCNTTISTILFILVAIVFFTILAMERSHKVYIVYIDETQPGHYVSEKFLSIALDTSVIANHFKNFNTTNSKLLKLVSALSPAYWRIGGTMADRLIFVNSSTLYFKHNFNSEFDGGDCSYGGKYCSYSDKPNFTMNGNELLQLYTFGQQTNLDIIFDLNSLQRFTNGSWDYRNAENLIQFSSDNNLTLNWELGNEPNAFRHQFNYDVPPQQMAADFHTLKNLLQKFPKYTKSLIVGPDVTRPEINKNKSKIYLANFLRHGSDVVNAVTWHQYYFNGRNAKMKDFVNPKIFNILTWQITSIQHILQNLKIHNKSIWLGETSSAYGGGAPGLSNRFIASFIWLDKLGIAAKYGIDVVIRQSIFNGYYALIDYDYEPTTDWWVSILYKKLVGRKVIQCNMPHSNKIRLYCHCTPSQNNRHSVTVFGMNLNRHKIKIRFEGITPININVMKNLTVQAYILTTMHRLNSRRILLNDAPLHLTKSDNIPPLLPKIILANPYVLMPAYSLAFWILPTGKSSPC